MLVSHHPSSTRHPPLQLNHLRARPAAAAGGPPPVPSVHRRAASGQGAATAAAAEPGCRLALGTWERCRLLPQSSTRSWRPRHVCSARMLACSLPQCCCCCCCCCCLCCRGCAWRAACGGEAGGSLLQAINLQLAAKVRCDRRRRQAAEPPRGFRAGGRRARRRSRACRCCPKPKPASCMHTPHPAPCSPPQPPAPFCAPNALPPHRPPLPPHPRLLPAAPHPLLRRRVALPGAGAGHRARGADARVAPGRAAAQVGAAAAAQGSPGTRAGCGLRGAPRTGRPPAAPAPGPRPALAPCPRPARTLGRLFNMGGPA